MALKGIPWRQPTMPHLGSIYVEGCLTRVSAFSLEKGRGWLNDMIHDGCRQVRCQRHIGQQGADGYPSGAAGAASEKVMILIL
jgi:hypothetical protein